jgi:hypothetical protein
LKFLTLSREKKESIQSPWRRGVVDIDRLRNRRPGFDSR